MEINMSFKVELQDAVKTETLDQDKIISPQKTVDRFKEKSAKVKSCLIINLPTET